MLKSPCSLSGKITYHINGGEYQSIEEVPAEYRPFISQIIKNPPKESKITVTKQNYAFSGLPDANKAPNQKKFLEEVVLPNLHLMDDKTKGEVLKELCGATRRTSGFSFRIHPLFWIAIGAAIPILMILLLVR